MKLVYKGNVLNFHTYPLARALYELLGEDFTFITDTKNSRREATTSLGRDDSSLQVPWAINTSVSETNKMRAEEKIQECDVLLTLEAYNRDYWSRIKENKVTFFYSERLFKPSMLKPHNPKIIAAMILGHTRFRNKKAFMLCNSAYLPSDLRLYGAYPDKLFRWGYFPETKYYSEETLREKKNHRIELLWVGGMAKHEWWKHPELAIEIMKRFKQEGISAHLTLVGDGELRSECEGMVKKSGLKDRVTFMGKLAHEDVLEYMLMANIYLFTSDYEEGWGVVLNEAMNQGCAVVASHAAGATPFLVQHGKNGLIYRCGDIEDLFHRAKSLAVNKERCLQMGLAAYHTVADIWNAEAAAARLVDLSNGILSENMLQYNEGPCSSATVVKQKQMYHTLVEGRENTT